MKKGQYEATKSKCKISNNITIISIFLFVISISAGAIIPFQQESMLSSSDYRIGARDLLDITVFELPELNQSVRVSEDGSISFSLLGRVDVAGLTVQELEKKLASILDQQYTKVAHVSVFISEYQKVAVLGAVMNPGMYELAGSTTLLQIIANAGGLTEQAKNELFIDRLGRGARQNRITINLDDLMIIGNYALNIELQPKDTIIIPIDKLQSVFVYGQVNTPGVVQYLSSKKITLLQAITQAGGPTDWAKERGVMIKRRDKETGNEKNISVNLLNVIRGEISDIVLEDGDIVIVP